MKTDTKLFIDRTLVLPLAWAANLAARSVAPFAKRDHTVDEAHVHTIVVAKLLGMGSIIQATPLLHDLRRRFPKAKLLFLTAKGNRGLIERLDTIIDEGVYIDDSSPQSLAESATRAVVTLLGRKVDLYFDLEIYSAGASVLSVLSGARNRVGFYRSSARFKKGSYTHLTVFNPRAPIAAIYRQLHLSTGGRKSSREIFGPISVRSSDQESLLKTLTDASLRLEPRYVLVNPNASDLLLERRWPTANWIALVTELAARGQQLVLVGAKSEMAYVNEILAELPPAARARVVDTSGKLSLSELFALIKGAACVVTNDTGPMHFSVALDRPTVCLFGPSNPHHYGSRKGNVETIYHRVYCSPCVHEIDMPPCAGVNICMQLINVPEVLAAVERRLAGQPPLKHLPIADVTYTGPHGEALGVFVRSSVNTMPEEASAGDEGPESEVVDSGVVSVDSRNGASR